MPFTLRSTLLNAKLPIVLFLFTLLLLLFLWVSRFDASYSCFVCRLIKLAIQKGLVPSTSLQPQT